jgi:alkanesulfonate monooxygenase SsuD/methylene tetrahydromethanopterin reductase-like flavin-dependent oxidoreductase (luciferase family)
MDVRASRYSKNDSQCS